MEEKKKAYKENILTTKSNLSGLAGVFETLLRKFRTGMFLLALLPLYFVGIIAMGISATPGVYFFFWIKSATAAWDPVFHYFMISTAAVLAYFIYGFCLIFVIPFFNFLIPFKIKPFRGNYFSYHSVPWYIHNALTYIVRYTFLEFVTPTPLNVLFYKMMGMKVGKGVHINTTNISDPGLIEIGNYVTIGGSATIIAHYGQKGYLVLGKVKIGDGVTIGMKSTVMGDVEIGPGAMIAPHEVIFPKSRIPAHRKPPKNNQLNNQHEENKTNKASAS
ncbi:acyltransferase [Calditrichota bacterium GD2]